VRPSGADVRPPLEVFVSGAPRAAQAGRTFNGAFEFRAGGRVILDSLRLSGERWRIRRFRSPARRELEAGSCLNVPFSAVPADPLLPLVLQYRVSGRVFRKSFDLSPGAAARVQAPGSVSSHPRR